MFIRASHYGEYINSDDIVRLRAGHPGEQGRPGGKVIAELRNGHYAELAEYDPDDVVAKVTPIIPATAGYEALWTVRYEDDPRIDVIRHPVLGWRESPYGGLTPVTYEDELSSNVHFAGVKYPDGRVCVPVETTYASEKEWFEEIQNEERKRRVKVVKPVDPFGEPA